MTTMAGTMEFQFEPLEIAFHCAVVPVNVMLVKPEQLVSLPLRGKVAALPTDE